MWLDEKEKRDCLTRRRPVSQLKSVESESETAREATDLIGMGEYTYDQETMGRM